MHAYTYCFSRGNRKKKKRKTWTDWRLRVQRENVWQTESLWFHSLPPRQLFRKLKAVKGSRLPQRCYNGWWLIEMAAQNCIMSARWWDHDHGKETRQRLIFHSGKLITSSHIIYCSSKIHPVMSQLLTNDEETERGREGEREEEGKLFLMIRHTPTLCHAALCHLFNAIQSILRFAYQQRGINFRADAQRTTHNAQACWPLAAVYALCKTAAFLRRSSRPLSQLVPWHPDMVVVQRYTYPTRFSPGRIVSAGDVVAVSRVHGWDSWLFQPIRHC